MVRRWFHRGPKLALVWFGNGGCFEGQERVLEASEGTGQASFR